MSRILVADDDDGHRLMLEALLRRWGLDVETAVDGREAVAKIETPFDAVLMDIRMPHMDGMAALKEIVKRNPAIPVVIMTAYSAVDSAVEALKSGAYDYLIKPLDFDVLRLTLDRALEHSRLKTENIALKERMRPGIVGNSPAMRRMMDMIEAVAPSEATVLITGKSGTGKELVARAIHSLSPRNTGPWVAVNCAALAENLLESELFGHEKGAFTGADKRRDGRFLQASGGTLFLDEIGEISPHMQVKLLRAIQQREIQRVGGDATLPVDVRLVAATNRDLMEEIREGRFREDLYYRLNVVSIVVPPLTERREDIPALAQHFLNKYGESNKKSLRGFTPRAMDMLIRYDWPGNVRELENAMERAVVLSCGDFISEREMPATVQDAYGAPHQNKAPSTSLEDVERDFILQTLSETGNNKSEAAKRLGISRKTLHSKLKNYAP